MSARHGTGDCWQSLDSRMIKDRIPLQDSEGGYNTYCIVVLVAETENQDVLSEKTSRAGKPWLGFRLSVCVVLRLRVSG